MLVVLAIVGLTLVDAAVQRGDTAEVQLRSSHGTTGSSDGPMVQDANRWEMEKEAWAEMWDNCGGETWDKCNEISHRNDPCSCHELIPSEYESGQGVHWGVHCDMDAEDKPVGMTYMNLSRNKLKGYIPYKINYWRHLQHLDLSYNAINYFPDYSMVTSLKHMDLSYNYIDLLHMGPHVPESIKFLDVTYNMDRYGYPLPPSHPLLLLKYDLKEYQSIALDNYMNNGEKYGAPVYATKSRVSEVTSRNSTSARSSVSASGATARRGLLQSNEQQASYPPHGYVKQHVCSGEAELNYPQTGMRYIFLSSTEQQCKMEHEYGMSKKEGRTSKSPPLGLFVYPAELPPHVNPCQTANTGAEHYSSNQNVKNMGPRKVNWYSFKTKEIQKQMYPQEGPYRCGEGGKVNFYS
jgi:hypothetical protein